MYASLSQQHQWNVGSLVDITTDITQIVIYQA